MHVFTTARTLFALLFLPPLLAACTENVSGPPPVPADIAGVYRLVSIDGEPLPRDIAYALGYERRTEIHGGLIQITADARFTDASTFRIWYEDGSGYDEFTSADQGEVYLSRDLQVIQLRPSRSPAYVVSREGTALVQRWNDYELRYEKEMSALR